MKALRSYRVVGLAEASMLLLDQPEGVWRCLPVARPAVVRASIAGPMPPGLALEEVAIAGEETLLPVFPGVSVSGETASFVS